MGKLRTFTLRHRVAGVGTGPAIGEGFEWSDGRVELRLIDHDDTLSENAILFQDIGTVRKMYARTPVEVFWEPNNGPHVVRAA